MIRVAFIVGDYPRRGAQATRGCGEELSSAEVEVGIVSVPPAPFGGLGPAEIQLVAPYYHAGYLQAEREGYDAAVPLGTLDLGVDGGRSLVDIPIIGPCEAMLHIAAQLGERFGIICYHESVIPRQITQTRYYGMEPWIAGRRASGFKLKDIGANKDVMIKNFLGARVLADRSGRRRRHRGARHHPMSGSPQARLAEQGIGRARGGGHRRADPDGRPAGGSRPQAQPQALAEVECKAAGLKGRGGGAAAPGARKLRRYPLSSSNSDKKLMTGGCLAPPYQAGELRDRFRPADCGRAGFRRDRGRAIAAAVAAVLDGSRPARGSKSEGELTVYGSMNEEEALPYWQLFQDATGIKVGYVRSSDASILAHRDRVPRPPAQLGPRCHHAGLSASRRGAAAIRAAGGEEPDPAGAAPTGAGTASTAITMRPPTTPIWSKRRTCRRPTRSSSRTRNGPARSRSTPPTPNG